MSRAKSDKKISVSRVERVPRHILAISPQIQPAASDDEIFYPTNTTALHDIIPSIFSGHVRTEETTLPRVDDRNDKLKITRSISPDIEKPSLHLNGNIDNLKEIKDSNQGCCSWYNRLSFKQKNLFQFIIAILIILAVAGAIFPPIYLFVIRHISQESSFTNMTVSACSVSTCIGKETPYRSSIVTALYPFDGNTNDLGGYATGTAFGGITYTPQGYVSQSTSTLIPASMQYIQIPNINFAQQSFTLQTWVFTPAAITAPSDYAIFGQCDGNSMCLSLSLRNGRITFSFDSMNSASTPLTGESLITSTLSWVHVTAAYDATLFQQQIYVNGEIDAVSHGIVSSYQGISSSSITTIGRSLSYAYPVSYYSGRIDQFTISAGVARNACQILNDATLVVHYPFDTTGTFNDYGVNLCNGVSSGITTISAGRVNQAISFPLTTSYIQAPCFPKMRGGDASFSISLWVNPSSTTSGGTLVHMSTVTVGNGVCYDHLVFTATGNLVVQWATTGPFAVTAAQGPVIPANTWTHVAVVANSVNGIRLFINGQFITSSVNIAALTLLDFTPAMYITLGNVGSSGPLSTISCLNGTIPILPGSYTGYIDEFRLYNRELDNQELCVLSNP